MTALNKISLLLCLIGIAFSSCTNEPKPPPVVSPAPSTLPLEMLTGTWEVSDAERNGKNTAALEGIYFTFTTDEKLTSNFNLSLKERTYPYQMQGDTLIALSEPEQSYLIQSLTEKGMVLRTKMEGYLFKLTLKTKQDLPLDPAEES